MTTACAASPRSSPTGERTAGHAHGAGADVHANPRAARGPYARTADRGETPAGTAAAGIVPSARATTGSRRWSRAPTASDAHMAAYMVEQHRCARRAMPSTWCGRVLSRSRRRTGPSIDVTRSARCDHRPRAGRRVADGGAAEHTRDEPHAAAASAVGTASSRTGRHVTSRSVTVRAACSRRPRLPEELEPLGG